MDLPSRYVWGILCKLRVMKRIINTCTFSAKILLNLLASWVSKWTLLVHNDNNQAVSIGAIYTFLSFLHKFHLIQIKLEILIQQ